MLALVVPSKNSVLTENVDLTASGAVSCRLAAVFRGYRAHEVGH